MSESQTTSSTAGVRTPTQNRLRSFGTQLQSIDPSSGIIDAFADVFAQIAAIESPQNPSNVSAQSESTTQTESSSQSDDNDETNVRESNDSDEVNAEKQEVDSDLAAIAIGSEQSETETETVVDETGDEDDVVAETKASDDKNANDTPAIAAVQVKSEASESSDEGQLNTSADADIVKVDPASEHELKQQKSAAQDDSAATDPLVRVQSGKQDATETNQDAATTSESLSTDATSETESESNSGDHRRDSRERPRDHFGPVNGGDRSGGGTPDEAASAPRSGQAASPSASATATLPIPESLTSVEATTTPTANVSPAAQQAVEAITQTAAAAAGAARTAATGNASSATSTNSAARDGSGAVSGPNTTASAADATTKRPEKGGNASTTDLISRAKLIQRVSRAFQHLGPDGGNVRLRLAPAELGTVRLEMQIKSNKIQTRVVAETEAAAAALRENLPELRARLQSQGMQIEQLTVEVEKDPQSGERSFSGHQSGAEQGGAGYSGDRWQSPRQSPRPRPTQDHGAAAGRGQINTPQIASQTTGVDVKL
ncbi:flagellar hook-length control protein FliK [Novipirellula sp. SH528]|uniref:flagellar hook-length control protein FliK n=1 Tax=Novipirellula sp. SH528 TaxID=3454466 RepID=UPI003F9FB6D9